MGTGLRQGQRNIVTLVRNAVIESLEDGVVALDAQMRVVDVNASAEGILDRSSAEMIGQSAEEALSDWPGLLELLGKVTRSGTEMKLEQEVGQRILRILVSPVHDQGERPSGVFVVLQDVTERRQAEIELKQARDAVEAAKQAKSEFMSVASHEMRTPITCIKGYTDLLAKGTVGPVDDAQAEFLGTIRANADRIACLVSDLSDIARIEAGSLRLELTSVALDDAIREAVESVKTQVEEKSQVLTVDVPDGLPCVYGDHDRLVQVLTHLLSNAHKFTPPGGAIGVLAELLEDRDEGERIHIAVRDNGIGIAAEEQEHVFEKFYRSEDRPVSEVPGSGLGLSIARSLVEMQGGRIWLESTFRAGTTVEFCLPVAEKTGASDPRTAW